MQRVERPPCKSQMPRAPSATGAAAASRGTKFALCSLRTCALSVRLLLIESPLSLNLNTYLNFAGNVDFLVDFSRL